MLLGQKHPDYIEDDVIKGPGGTFHKGIKEIAFLESILTSFNISIHNKDVLIYSKIYILK